jgi:hypothetical protein
MVASYTSQRLNEAWDVSDHGFLAGTVRIPDIATSSLPTSGTIYFNKFVVRRAITVSNIWFNITTVGATPTAGQNWLGIYDSSGRLLQKVSTDANVTGGNAQTVALTTPLFLPKGTYYVAMLWNAVTTPTIHRITLATNAAANMNLTPRGYGTVAAQTDLPATTDPSTWSTTFNIWGLWFN